MTTVTIATLPLPEIDGSAAWQNDNSLILSKKELWTSVALTLTPQEQETIYAWWKQQREKAGLPL